MEGPFIEVKPVEYHDDPSLIGWEAVKNIASCDYCYESATDDYGDGMAEPRKFYKTTDGYDLIVCERCCDQYVKENAKEPRDA